MSAALQIREYAGIVDRIAADAPESILDWGCGLGQVSNLLHQAGLNVTSFDYRGPESPDAEAPLHFFPSIEAYLSSDPRRLPYPDSTFEAVLSCGVLEHVLDPDASLEELARVLRPGGTLYVYKLPNRFSYLEKLAKRMGRYYHGLGPHEPLYTPRSARALLERHGYRVRDVQLVNMLPLTVGAGVLNRRRVTASVWAANVALGRVPGVQRLATNVQLVAAAPGGG